MKTKYYTGSQAVNRKLAAAEERGQHVAFPAIPKQPRSMSWGELLKYVSAAAGLAAIIGSIAACAALCGV